jgi:hypothetical protein
MGELVHLTSAPEQSKESETDEQLDPTIDGANEQDTLLERSDVDALVEKAGELKDIDEVQRGLEECIIGSGLQVIVDRYGADKFLAAVQQKDEHGDTPRSLRQVIERLAPNKKERKALYREIREAPMADLADQFDEQLGGVVDATPIVSAMERFRGVEMATVEHGLRKGHDGATDSSIRLLGYGTLTNVLEQRPDMAERFRDSGDTLGLLKDIRDVYVAEYAQFTDDLELAKAAAEASADMKTGEAYKLEETALDILSEEISRLDERRKAETDEHVLELLEAMYRQKVAEAEAYHADYEAKAKGVRLETVEELGSDRLDHLTAKRPAQVRKTYNDNVKAAA